MIRNSLILLRNTPGAQAWRAASTVVDIPTSSIRSHLQDAEKAEATPGRRTAYLYFDSVFPIRISALDPRILWSRATQDTILQKLRAIIPTRYETDVDLRVESIKPRDKDGGCFVKISYVPPRIATSEGSGKSAELVVNEAVESWLREQLSKSVNQYKPWYIYGQSSVFIVKGQPWIEDMDRFPNSAIRIEFSDGAPPSQEQLYELTRPYGRIRDIIPDAKAPTVQYRFTRSAAAARNSLDGYKLPTGQTMHILYQDRVKAHMARKWLSDHPRITIPVLAVLLGGLSYLIFDPIRSWFVRAKVEGTFDADSYRALSWIKKETLGRLGLKSEKGDTLMNATGIEQERENAAHMLEEWLKDLPDAFINVVGPRGSGKGMLLEDVMESYRHVVTIDCAALAKASSSDEKLVAELAAQLGYFPQFGFLNSFNNLIDLASVGLVGSKAGFSSSVDSQVKQILTISASALKDIADNTKEEQAQAFMAAEDRRKSKEERSLIRKILERDGLRDGRIDCLAGNGIMSELGVGLEAEGDGEKSFTIAGPRSLRTAKSIAQDTDEEKFDPAQQTVPIIILKNFNAKQGKEMLWEQLSEWGAGLVSAQVAHVIATSDNALSAKPLAKALPSKPVNTITLTDASVDGAIQHVKSKLVQLGKQDVLTDEASISHLGGRLTDLEALVQKLRSGTSCEDAVEDIISRAASEVKKNIFGESREEAKAKEWTPQQAWYLTKLLSQQEEANYADVLVNGPFGSDDKALNALEQAEMVSVIHRDGRPTLLRPGKPVYRSAFARLTSDRIFAARQELLINAAASSSAEANIKSASDELINLTNLFSKDTGKFVFTGSSSTPIEIAARVDALLSKMKSNEETAAKLAIEASKYKAVLKEPYSKDPTK